MISKLSKYIEPATTKSGPYESFEKSSQIPIAGCTSTPPIAPPNPPRPTTDPTPARGKQSDVIVKRLADHPWCALAARPISATVSHKLPAVAGTSITGTTQIAQTSIAIFLARPTGAPRFNRNEDSQPPPIDPTSAAR